MSCTLLNTTLNTTVFYYEPQNQKQGLHYGTLETHSSIVFFKAIVLHVHLQWPLQLKSKAFPEKTLRAHSGHFFHFLHCSLVPNTTEYRARF